MRVATVSASSAMIGALVITIYLGCVSILTNKHEVELTFEDDVGRIKAGNDPQVTFPEFRNMCIKACKNAANPEASCDPTKISSHWTEYLNACTANKYRCSLPQLGCGGEWREDMLN
jgi:hypothetical protein